MAIAIPIIHSATVMCDIRLGSNYMYTPMQILVALGIQFIDDVHIGV